MPDRPLMPPFRPMEFLPFSFTLSSRSTVPFSAFCWVSVVLVDLQRVEVAELVQAQQAQLPELPL